jgi:hypothetical protein
MVHLLEYRRFPPGIRWVTDEKRNEDSGFGGTVLQGTEKPVAFGTFMIPIQTVPPTFQFLLAGTRQRSILAQQASGFSSHRNAPFPKIESEN